MTQTDAAAGVEALVRGVSTLPELWERADALLRPLLGYDVAAFASLDPSTLLWTSCDTFGIDHDAERESVLFECEYGADDFLQIANLATADRPAASLHAETDGDLSRCRRYRLLFEDFGVTDELRIVLRDGDRCWASVCAYRADGVFSDDLVGLAASFSQPLATAVRHVLLAALDGAPRARPGSLVLGAGGQVLSTTETAEDLLREIDCDRVPAAVRSVVMAARRGRVASVTLGTEQGTWISLHAMAAKGGGTSEGADDIVVVVEPARPPALAQVIVDAYGLTTRERDVLGQLLRAEPVKRIARHLQLSEHTVRDHLKHIYRKVGGQSRQEVAHRIFHEHYLPRHRREEQPSPFGFFEP